MHLKELVLPDVVLNLPFSRHAAASVAFLVEQKQLKALGNLLTNERDAILNELVLLGILHHEAKVFADFILYNWLDRGTGSCHFNMFI